MIQALIMAAGESTRTHPLTLTRPKPLLPVGGEPLLAHQLRALSGIADEVILIVGYRQDMIRARFGDSFEGMKLRYVEQRERLGTGHAVLQAAPFVQAPFLVMNGDDLYAPDDLRQLARRRNAALARHVDAPERFGVFEIKGNDRVARLVEKPTTFISSLANIGAYVFTPEVFAILEKLEPTSRGEVEITCAVQRLADAQVFSVAYSQGYYLSVAYPWHLLDANTFWLERFLVPEISGEVSDRAVLSGSVHIGKGTVIRPGVVIEGPVFIGDGCVVGPNCWIRPHSTLCDGCRVGQGSEIKASILMEGAAALHQNYVGDSIVGAHANLGCGTNTANFRHDRGTVLSAIRDGLVDTGREKLGAIIGDHVRTGINTAIYPGRKIWPGLTTLPGAVVRRDIRE